VAKVKKDVAVTRSGGKTATRGKRAPSGASKLVKVAQSKRSAVRKSKPTSKNVGAKRRLSKGRTGVKAAAPAPVFRVDELVPQSKCGPGTSVQRLFRVRESTDGVTRSHLVFFDRHGWYCEHGRNCQAVSPAVKFGDRARR